MQIVIISGLSGSGKSIALNVLEDASYYVVDNLPAALLPQLVTHLRGSGWMRAAVAIDTRSGASVAALPGQLEQLRQTIDDLRVIFLEARNDTLITRFSETRRRHPLAAEGVSLEEAINRERETLAEVAELAHRIDTSDMHPNTLRAWVKDFANIEVSEGMALMFQSFGFKYGIPVDADLVFDVRCLPNPHYDPLLRPLTGRDEPVKAFLRKQPEVERMAEDIRKFLVKWLPAYLRENRSYLTVAIGCTGGQHRSVYLAEWLAERFQGQTQVLVRHRSAARRAADRAAHSGPGANIVEQQV